jgi:Bacteriophage HK97-gp10, putative tail-component
MAKGVAVAAKFQASYTGIGEMIRSPGMEQAMRAHAEKIKTKAEATAPVGDPSTDPHAGRYRDSFKVESGRDGGVKKDRAYGRVLNDAPEAFYVEYGSSKVAAHHTLLNAAQAVKE